MYKVLVVALTAITLGLAIEMVLTISNSLSYAGRFVTSPVSLGLPILYSSARFLVALSMLYWLPKLVAKHFPEVR